MAQQIKKTQKLLIYFFSLMLGAVSSWFVFGKEERAKFSVTSGFEYSEHFTPRANADTPSADGGDRDGADAPDGGGGNGGGGGDGCFIAGTLVTLSDGTKMAIENVRQGMKILGEGGEVFVVAGLLIHDGIQAFMHDYVHEPYMTITFDNGASFDTVGGHPISVNQGYGWYWSNMSDLRVGTSVRTERGVASVVDVTYKSDVRNVVLYNLELVVAPGQERSYYANGILVRDTQQIDVPISRWFSPDQVRERIAYDYTLLV